MILVENSSFAATPDNSSSQQPLTPFTPFDNSPASSAITTFTDEAYDLDLDEIDQLLFSDQEEQSGRSRSSSSSGQESVHSHQDHLISGSDLFYGSYLAEEEEDSSFLELDLSDVSSEEQEDEVDLSSLTPSVQRLFCSTSMSNYSALSATSSVLSGNLLEQQHQQLQVQLQQQQQQLQLQLQQETVSVGQQRQFVSTVAGSGRVGGVTLDSGRPFAKNAFPGSHLHQNQLQRQNSNIFSNSKVPPYVFSCSSSSTSTGNTHFDNISASGSSSSSTPSTPGGYQSQPSSSASSTSSILPSFSEIYSPRGSVKGSNFDCTGDFFKFEDAFSEGDNSCISAEGDENCTAAALQLAIERFPTEQLISNGSTSTVAASSHFDLHHPQIILKEEPMDSFVSTSSSNVSNQTLCNFVQQQQQPKQEITQQTTNEQQQHQIKEDNTMLFRADSPKPMRYHLHSLSLNVMQQQQQQLQQQSVCDQGVPFESDPFESDETSIERLVDFESQLIQQQSGSAMPLLMNTQGMQSLLGGVSPSALAAGIVEENTANPMDHIGSAMACAGVSTGSPSLFARNSPIGGGKMRTAGSSRPHKTAMQICAVCGDVAACQHYGVLTCEGCKGFFKRTVQKNSKYTCLGNKDCTVDKRRRNRCQSCRFAKCLAVGMVKEVVRTDSLKGRRGRLPSKPKNSSETPPVFPVTTISALVKAHVDTSNDKQNLDFSQYSDNVNLSNDQSRTHIDSQLLTMLNRSLNNLYVYMEKIPGFNEFNEHDRKILFQNSCLELFALRMAYRIKPGSLYFIFSNNVVMHRNQFAASFGEWLPLIEQLSNQLNSMELDISSFACLSALTVIAGRCGVQNLAKVDELETKIINALKDHTMYHCDANKKPNYLSRILSKLSELRNIGELGHRVVSSRLAAFTQATANAEIRDLAKKLSIASGPSTSTPSSSFNTCPSTSNSTVRMDVQAEEGQINLMSSSAAPLPDLSCLDLPSISSFFKWQNSK